MQARSGDFRQSSFMTEYVSARWFELMRRVVKEFLRLGLGPYLYDENSYPSGLAPVSGGAHHGRIGGASAQEFSPVRW
jgi:hypothetical protein